MIVKRGHESFEIAIRQITQLCGTNIIDKSFIVNSIEKHFSTYKYKEYEEDMMDNISIGGEIPGREYFNVTVLRSREDILKEFRLNKNGRMLRYLKSLLNEYDNAEKMERIECLLDSIFEDINQKLLSGRSDMIFSFAENDLFEILQKSQLCMTDDRLIEEIGTCELIYDLLMLIEEMNLKNNRKNMMIFENIDHMITRQEYTDLMHLVDETVCKADIWVVFTMSINGFAFIDEKWFQGINCINDIVYNMPDYMELKRFIEFNYPLNKVFSRDEYNALIKASINNFGSDRAVGDIRGYVIEKLVNQTELLCTFKEDGISYPEKKFLGL